MLLVDVFPVGLFIFLLELELELNFKLLELELVFFFSSFTSLTSSIGAGFSLELDDEALTTINKFFENNLNVSETSRQLFVHRNTLVYRIEKIQKGTGLDLRSFDDALTFKIALMVVNYMKYLESLQ